MQSHFDKVSKLSFQIYWNKFIRLVIALMLPIRLYNRTDAIQRIRLIVNADLNLNLKPAKARNEPRISLDKPVDQHNSFGSLAATSRHLDALAHTQAPLGNDTDSDRVVLYHRLATIQFRL